MGDQKRHLTGGEFCKTFEGLKFAFSIECGCGLIQNQKLRVPEIGSRKRNALPFASREIDAAFKASAQHLVVAFWKLSNHLRGLAFSGSFLDACQPDGLQGSVAVHTSDDNVFSCCHLVSHEVLKYHANFVMQILDGIIAQIDTVEQDLTLGDIVKAGNELDDRGLSLPILSDQRNPLTRHEDKVEIP